MAQPCTRTAADDLSDALQEVNDALKALRNWRDQLTGLQAYPTAQRARGAARAKNIAVNLVIDAGAHTQQACDALTSGSCSTGSPRSPH